VKRVAVVAYHFPPVGGAGVQRSTAFARYLPEFGYEPVVITGPGEQYGEWTPLDVTLAAGLPAGLEVVRVPGPVPPDSPPMRSRAERWLRLTSPFTRWWREGAVRVGSGLRDVELVYASLSPFESAEAGLELARRLGAPCVLDLRDPWALDEMLTFATGLHHRLEVERMGRALKAADAVIMNCPEALARVRARWPELRGVLDVVTNGFDAADFADAAESPPAEGFRIVHTGFLHTGFGHERRRGDALRRLLGGTAQADPLTRSHVVLLEALDRVRRADAALGAGLELHLAGALSESDRAVDGRGFVREHGYLPHAESVRLMRSADLLFLPMHDLPPGVRATIVPGKTYEYLGSTRPLLAAVPDGDARDWLEALPWAHVARPTDPAAMADIVAALAARKRERGPEPDGDRALVARFERRQLTAGLARVFDATLSGSARSEVPAAA
jgi:Glycosyltransferase Family 4